MKRVVLFLTLLLFSACENPHPEITLTLETDYSEVIAAIRQSNQSLADKLALIEASVRDGMADNEAAMKLIETAVSSLNGSMSEKLAAIEAALSAQTTSLETKLSLIEAAVAAGFADGQAQQDLLRTALESLGGSMEDKLSAIEEAIGSQTTSLMAKLGLIEGAMQSGFADVTTAQELLQEVIDSLGETLGEKIAAIEKAVSSQTTSLAAKLALIEAAVEQGFAGQAASQELIRTALDSLTGSVEDKLAALEAAMESQTVSLETKLDAVAEAAAGNNVAGEEALELIRKAIESMNGNLSSKLSAIEKAVSDQTKSLETKLDLIEAAVSSGVTDIKQAQDLIRQAIDGAGTSLGEKIAAIEQAIGSQTTSLSAKLGLIETAVKNGLADEKKELDLISQALGTLDGDVKDKLDALERAMTSQTSGLETKLGAIAKAVEDGFVDEGKALALVQQALGTLKDSVDGVDTDLKGKIDEVTEAVGKVSTALTGDLSQKLTEIFNAIQGMKDYSAILDAIKTAIGNLGQGGGDVDDPGKINGHAYVDMGEVTIVDGANQLKKNLKWATCNIGAENPWDYGDYYAWGETATKESYAWTNYIFAKDPSDYSNGVKKYSEEDSYKTLFPEDDAATSLWKDPWRMPTEGEWAALRDEKLYTWKWETNYNGSGKNGMLVTRKEGTGPCAGNSIFLPAAGRWFESQWLYGGSQGFYWSSSLDTVLFAMGVEVLDSGSRWLTADRYAGLNVRPVTE